MACRKNLSGLASYFLGDALGSVRQLTDAAGAVTLAKTYDPYGRLRSLAQSAGTPSTSLGFTGEVTDPAASSTQDALVYLRARYYDPGAGRFTTRDSWPGVSEQPQSLNRYAYGLDNPVLYTDPSGHCGYLCAGLAMTLAGAIYFGGIDVLKQLSENDGRWDCINWSDVAKYTLAGAMFGASLAIALITFDLTPDYFVDLGLFWYDAEHGNADNLMLDGLAMMIPGISSAMGHAGELTGVASGVDDAVGLGGALDGAGAAGDLGAAASEAGDAARSGMETAGDIGDAAAHNGGLGDAISNCINSFSADTLVKTDKGERPISEIKVGDKVLAYNEENKTTDYYPVTDVLVHTDPVVEHLMIDHEEIKTTPEHPFYTEEKGWLTADKLQPGSHVRKADGTYGQVNSVTFEKSTRQMYNLTVGTAHTYFVGAGEWLVHNACPPLEEGTAITKYDPKFAAKQLIKNGKISVSDMQAAIPQGTPNIFVPSGSIPQGYKYQFQIGDAAAEFKWHAPDANVLAKYGPSSNAGVMWTAQIKVNGLLLGLDLNFYAQQMGNLTHIPVVWP